MNQVTLMALKIVLNYYVIKPAESPVCFSDLFIKKNMETSLIASKKTIDKSIKSLQYITDISFQNGVKQKWTVLYNNYG